MLLCTPLARLFASFLFVVSLLLFDLLLCSSCSTCCSTLLVEPTLLLLLDLLLRSTCLTCCFTLLAQLAVLLLLFNLLFCSSCLIGCIPLVQPIVLLFLFDIFVQVPFCYAHDFVTPCSFCLTLLFCSFCLRLVLPPPFSYRCGVWRSCPNSSFSCQTWKVKFFVFNFDLLMIYFFKPCFWEMVVSNVFVFLCRNYLDIVHLIMHIAFHFYTLHFICTIVLCIF